MKQLLQINKTNRFLLFIYIASFGFSPKKTVAQDATGTQYKNNIIVLPALGSSPETSFLFGGVGIYQFKMGDPGVETRPAAIVGSGIYTLKNQSSFALESSLILEGEKWMADGVYAYSYFPEAFWGVGRNTDDKNEMRLIYRQFDFSQSALRQVLPKLFIGPKLRWTKNYNIHFENPEGDTIESPSVTGANDYSSAGIGFSVRWDERDRMMAPTKNHMLALSVMTNPSWLGTIDSYTTYLLDARKYLDLSDNGSSVLAFQFRSELTGGNPPIKEIAMLGGQNIMRGYYEGRLRDRHGAQIQGELRQQVYRRFGMALFASAGQVWNSFNDMELGNSHFSAGGGLRFNLNKEDPTNIRVDYGIGIDRNTSGVYITIGEAF